MGCLSAYSMSLPSHITIITRRMLSTENGDMISVLPTSAEPGSLSFLSFMNSKSLVFWGFYKFLRAELITKRSVSLSNYLSLIWPDHSLIPYKKKSVNYLSEHSSLLRVLTHWTFAMKMLLTRQWKFFKCVWYVTWPIQEHCVWKLS